MLVALFVVFALRQASEDHVTVDEAVYVASGVTALTRHDLRLNPEQPPLAKALAAVPVLLADPVIPDGDTWEDNVWFDYTADFVDAQQATERLDRVTFAARIVPVLVAVLGAALLVLLGLRLFGWWEGVLAAALWLTTPVVLGHGHLATTDVPFAVATLGVCLLLARYLDSPSVGRAVALGAATGAAMLTRYTGLALALGVIVSLVAAGWRHRRATAMAVATVALVAWASVWVGVRVVAPNEPDRAAAAVLESAVADGRDESLVARVGVAIPWPLEYRAGIAYAELTSDARPGYTWGTQVAGTTPWYWAAASVVKLPPTTLVLVPAGIAAWALVAPATRRRALVVLAPAALVLLLPILLQPRPIGVRYLLPVLALLFVAAGPAVRLARWRLGAASLGVLLAVQTALWLTAGSSALAWTSPLLRPGYRYASDSDLDWGQALGVLAERTAELRPAVALVGPRGVTIEDFPGAVPLEDVPPDELEGWVAVSASALTVQEREELAWLRAYCPVDTVDGAILLYFFEEPPERATDPPDQPASLCEGGPSRLA